MRGLTRIVNTGCGYLCMRDLTRIVNTGCGYLCMGPNKDSQYWMWLPM